jgi:hypothetical protein
MLRGGSYVSQKIANVALAEQGAICGGHYACLVGSAYIAGGVAPTMDSSPYWSDSEPRAFLRSAEISNRGIFLDDHPEIAAALHALDSAAARMLAVNEDYAENARDWLDEQGYDYGDAPGLRAEALFEGNGLRGQAIIDLLNLARERAAA